MKAALESKAEIVVVCASDDDYAEARTEGEGAARRQSHSRQSQALPHAHPNWRPKASRNFIRVKIERPGDSEVLLLKQMGIYDHES